VAEIDRKHPVRMTLRSLGGISGFGQQENEPPRSNTSALQRPARLGSYFAALHTMSVRSGGILR